MDPFRPGGMGSVGGDIFGRPPHPGQLPRFLMASTTVASQMTITS